MVSNKEINRKFREKRYRKRICPECGTENPDNAAFCPECGIKLLIHSDSKEPLPNNDIEQDDVSFMQITSQVKNGFTVDLNKKGLLLGKRRTFGDKVNYTNIAYEDIEKIVFKKSGTKYGHLKIKTNNRKFTVPMLLHGSGEALVNVVKEIMSGNKEIFNRNPYVDIKTDEIPIYSTDSDRPYMVYGKVSVSADSSLLSKTATMDDANGRLREEAVKLGANAIINAKYQRGSLYSWRGMTAEGIAVFIESNEKKCPFCTEMVKKEAVKCKHCGNDLSQSENNQTKEAESNKVSQADELRKFAQLRDEGIITEEEFELKKKEILGL